MLTAVGASVMPTPAQPEDDPMSDRVHDCSPWLPAAIAEAKVAGYRTKEQRLEAKRPWRTEAIR